MPQIWDMGHIILLPLRKIQRLRPGLNPRTRVPVASMLITRPTKPSSFQKCLFSLYLSLLVSRFLTHMLKFFLLLNSLEIILVFFRYIFIPKTFCSMNYVLLAFFILSSRSIW